MTLPEKIITLRKERGWSQEDLADKLDVSRQSVSKWEMGQSVPAIDSIIAISELFKVSCDTLLKDTTGDETPCNPAEDMDFIDAIKACHRIASYKAEVFSAICNSGIKMDDIVAIIRDATSRDDAKKVMIERFNITDQIANGILDIKMPELSSGAKHSLSYYKEARRHLEEILKAT